MIYVEKFGVPQLFGAIDAGVKRVSFHVQLQGRGVEEVGQVELLLPRNVGQVGLGFVHGLGQAQLSQMFLEKIREFINKCLYCNFILLQP